MKLALFAAFIASQFTIRRRVMIGRALGALLLLILSAGSAQAGSVTLAWDPNSESDLAGYILLYGTAPGVYTNHIDVGNQTSWTVAGLTDGQHYYFAVKAYNQIGSQSAPSTEVDTIVTSPTLAFTDDVLTAGVNLIRAVHITELRQRIDALRQRVGLLPFTWTDPVLSGVFMKTVHILELRAALGVVYSAAGRTLPAYTDPALVAGETVIKAIHISELRAAVVALE
jgi:hypothetical protein